MEIWEKTESEVTEKFHFCISQVHVKRSLNSASSSSLLFRGAVNTLFSPPLRLTPEALQTHKQARTHRFPAKLSLRGWEKKREFKNGLSHWMKVGAGGSSVRAWRRRRIFPPFSANEQTAFSCKAKKKYTKKMGKNDSGKKYLWWKEMFVQIRCAKAQRKFFDEPILQGNSCVQAAFRCFNLTEKNIVCCCGLRDLEARRSLHLNLASVAYGKCCIFQSGWRRRSRIIFGFLDAFYMREKGEKEDEPPPPLLLPKRLLIPSH